MGRARIDRYAGGDVVGGNMNFNHVFLSSYIDKLVSLLFHFSRA